MQPPMKILVVEDNPGDARLLIEQLKEEGPGQFELHWANQLHAAMEALDRHTYDASPAPFDAILLDLNLGDSRGLDTFLTLHSKVPQIPVVLLTGLEDERLGLRAVQVGAQDYLVKGQANAAAVARALRFSIERNRSLQWHRSKSRHKSGGRAISFVGVKGGVGTTTVALSAAAMLAQERLVAAAEWNPDLGHFAPHFRGVSGPSMPDLFAMPTHELNQQAVERHLVNSQLGFHLLLGPATFERRYAPDASRCQAILAALLEVADFAVMDFPSLWSAAHTTLLPKSHAVVLVTERDDLSLIALERAVTQLRRMGVAQDALLLGVVNRSPSLDAVSKEKLEQVSGIPVAGMVPPAPDICLAAHRAGAPVSVFRHRSAPAGALAAIAQMAAQVAAPTSPSQAA